jgi:hypothetical protein
VALMLRTIVAFVGTLALLVAYAWNASAETQWQVMRLPGASAVVVDVVEVTAGGGTQVGNDRAAVRISADAAPSDAWALDLATVPTFPTDCTRRTYFVRWAPDGADCTASPASCSESTATIGGAACFADPRVQEILTYATDVVAAQGITKALLEHFGRRGERPARWREIRRATDGDFATPESTEWEVYSYRQGPTWPEIACAVRTATNPATTLPTFTDCQ